MSILCSGSGEFHIVRVLVRSRVLTVTDADLVYFGKLVPNKSLQHGAVLFTDTEINEEIQSSINEDGHVNNVSDVRV